MKQRLQSLMGELRERSVFRAMVAYAVVVWVLLQIADVTFDRLPIPDSAMTILIVLIIIGFPITLILAWGYEITIEGVVRHEDTDGGAPKLARAKFLLLIAVVVVACGGLVYYVSQEHWEPSQLAIAVLPFANATNELNTDYFSDGLTEEIRSLIVRLNEFRVVAISTTNQLKGTVLDVATLAKRLRADVVLLGSVRRNENRLSVYGTAVRWRGRHRDLVGNLRPAIVRCIRDPGGYCAAGCPFVTCRTARCGAKAT